MAPDIRRKEKSAVHTRRAQEGPWREEPAPTTPRWGTVWGAGQGLGKHHQRFWACQKSPGPTLSQGQVFRAGVTFGPQIRARSLHDLSLDWKAQSGGLLEWLKSMVMRAQQLRSGGYKGPHKMATILAFSNGSFQQDTPLPSPQQPQLDADPVFPSCPYYSRKTQPSGLDNGMDWIEVVQEIRNSP